MRQKLNIPRVLVNKEVRFKLNELKAWARQYEAEIENQTAEAGQARPEITGSSYRFPIFNTTAMPL